MSKWSSFSEKQHTNSKAWGRKCDRLLLLHDLEDFFLDEKVFDLLELRLNFRFCSRSGAKQQNQVKPEAEFFHYPFGFSPPLHWALQTESYGTVVPPNADSVKGRGRIPKCCAPVRTGVDPHGKRIGPLHSLRVQIMFTSIHLMQH